MTLRTLVQSVLVAWSLSSAAFAQQAPATPQQSPVPAPKPPVIVEQQRPVVEQPAPASGTWQRPDRSRKPKMRVC